MTETSILKALVDKEHSLGRERTRKLATQQWAKVLEVEAKIEAYQEIRKLIAENPEPKTPNV